MDVCEHDFVLVLSVNNIHLSPVTSFQIYGFALCCLIWDMCSPCIVHPIIAAALSKICNWGLFIYFPYCLLAAHNERDYWRLNSPNTGAFEDNTLPLEFWTCDEWAGDMCPPVTRNGGASVRAVHRALAGALADHRVTGHGDYAVQQVPSLPSSTMLEQNIVQIHRQQSYQLTHWCLEVQI